jgi:hypothetical protein
MRIRTVSFVIGADSRARDDVRDVRDNFVRIGKSPAVLIVAFLGSFVAVGFSWEERSC